VADLQRIQVVRVQRQSVLCPYCGLDETLPKTFVGKQWTCTVMYCEWCQSTWDPLANADLSGKTLLEERIVVAA